MAAARSILSLTATLLLAGGITMQILLILSGLYGSPENQIYFLQASTNGVTQNNSNLRNPTRWTYLRLCGVDANGYNADCDGTTAALPFDPVKNFGTTAGIPAPFLNTHHYFYLSRFAWVFYLIALFFAVVALFISLAACFARLGAYLTGFFTFLALFAQAIAASLMTAWTVQGRNAWQANGNSASLGAKAYGFTWGTFGAFLIASVLYCVGGGVSKTESYSSKSSFRRRGKRSRGSFIDNESQRRVVKDEYE